MFKKIYLFVLLFCVASISYSQKVKESEVPKAALAEFQKQYPRAEKTKWRKESEGFVASFEDRNIKHLASFSTDGSCSKVVMTMDTKHVPDEVKLGVNKNLEGGRITKADHVFKIGQEELFILEVEKDYEFFEIKFTAKGTLISKELKK
jgi:hypothetical protein